MAVTVYKSSTTPSTSQGVTTSLAANDVAIAVAVSDNSGTTFTWPSGFTEQQTQGNGPDGQSIAWAIKSDCDGTEGTLTVSSSTNCLAAIIGISGADNTTPLDVSVPTPYTDSTGASSPFTGVLGITPVTDGAVLIALLGVDNVSSQSITQSASDTGGLSWTSTGHSNGGFYNLGISYATQATAAATTVTGSGTGAGTAGRSMFLIAVRPSSGGAATLDQSHFRWRTDDGSETTATWAAAEDTNVTIAALTPTRLRVEIAATNNPASAAYKLQYRKVGDSTWRDIN